MTADKMVFVVFCDEWAEEWNEYHHSFDVFADRSDAEIFGVKMAKSGLNNVRVVESTLNGPSGVVLADYFCQLKQIINA